MGNFELKFGYISLSISPHEGCGCTFFVILLSRCASDARFLFCCCISASYFLLDARSSLSYFWRAYQLLIWASCLNFWKSLTRVLCFKTHSVFLRSASSHPTSCSFRNSMCSYCSSTVYSSCWVSLSICSLFGSFSWDSLRSSSNALLMPIV